MAGKPAKNQPKKSEKIFSKLGKPHGSGISYLYLLDILISAWVEKSPPLTIADLLKCIADKEGHSYSRSDIEAAINNIHVYCTNIIINVTQVVAGRSRAKAFSINFKSEKI